MTKQIPIDPQDSLAPRRTFERVNTNDIMSKVFAPIRWIIPGYVPEGFSVMAGRQKLGKTWLAMDWAISVACGGCAMGKVMVDPGDVLYVDLENGSRRVQRRIMSLFPGGAPDLWRLDWLTDAPDLNAGFFKELDSWRASKANPRMVVIDVLQRIKPAGVVTRNAYENDYSTWAPLQKWANEHGIAVIGLHHTKKGGADDPLEALSGSNGLSACADTTLVLDRNSSGVTLYVRGRDVDEKESALHFSAGNWTLMGEADALRRSDERTAILDALAAATEPMTIADVTAATDMSGPNARKLLSLMAKAGQIEKAGRGVYRVARQPPIHNIHKITNEEDD